MPPSPSKAVVTIFWPMVIPAHARFKITSPFPLTISFQHNASFELRLETPIQLSSSSPIFVIPAGILSQGFARGWSNLPLELKLEILRYDLICPWPITPSNANRILRDILFPFLRMTPEIADLARDVFFGENTFVLVPSSETLSMGRGLPPVPVRQLIRKLTIVTSLDPADSAVATAIAKKKLGFDSLTQVEIKCSVVKLVRSSFPKDSVAPGTEVEVWSTRLSCRLPAKIGFEARGVIEFDRPQFGRGGADEQLLSLVDLVEGIVRERFKFGVSLAGGVETRIARLVSVL